MLLTIMMVMMISLMQVSCAEVQLTPPREGVTISAQDLKEAIISGESRSYNNVTVSGSLEMGPGDGPISQSLRITNSRFLGPVRLEAVVFTEGLDLRGCIFMENVSFVRSRFLGEARFSGAGFLRQADFGDAFFEDAASFISARFLNDTSFSNAQFSGDAVFLDSRFASDVDFDDAKFMRSGSFRNAAFEDVRFFETEFRGQATFLSAIFTGNATFAATRFGSDVVFRGCIFLRGSTFGLSSFSGLADFGDAEFNETAFLGGVRFSDLAYFAGAGFHRDLILEGARLYSMQLDDVAFSEKSRINLNSTDYTKFVVHWSLIRDRIIYNGAAYLALVKNYKSLEWFDEADECYYQYRRTGQSLTPWGWDKLSDMISWLSCGYGVRVSFTAFWCLFTILFFGAIFWAGRGMSKFEIVGMELPGEPKLLPIKRVSFADALYFSIAMFTTSQAPVNTYPVGVYRHLAMAEGILGWFFLGLFVVVLSAVLIR